MSFGNYSQWIDRLGFVESTDNWNAENGIGFLGRYQMGEAALQDVGYYLADGTSTNDWIGTWTGTDNVHSKADFLANHTAQTNAVTAYTQQQWNWIVNHDLDIYEGQTLDGLAITISGMLGGAHLVGRGKLQTYLLSGGDNVPTDGGNPPVAITRYIKTPTQDTAKGMGDYDTPFTADHTGNDSIAGGSGIDILRGFDGNDNLTGNGGNDELRGYQGNDNLTGGTGNDALFGGIGDDRYIMAASGDGFDTISDNDGVGRIVLGGVTLQGTADLQPDGHSWKLSVGGSDYTLSAQVGGLLIAGSGSSSVLVAGFKNGDLGIKLENDQGPVGSAANDFLYNQSLTTPSPLVIDLNGDGFHFRDIANGQKAYFNLKNNNFAVQTSWNSTSDGFLARDLNGNGIIDNVTELFGDNNGTSAWAKLAALDTNASGNITSADTAFSSLLVWQDADADGNTDAGELTTMAQRGITAISLQQNSNSSTVDGQTISGTATVTFTSGARSMTDVFFTTESADTWYVGDGTDASLQFDVSNMLLPQSRGYGTLPSLHFALTQNATLKTTMQDIVGLTGSNIALLTGKMEAFMFEWAGVTNVAPNSRGMFIDGRVLEFLEEMMDRPWLNGSNPYPAGSPQADPLWETWETIFHEMQDRFVVQGMLSEVFTQTTYNFSTDKLVWGESLSSMLSRAASLAPSYTSYIDWMLYWSAVTNPLVHHAWSDFFLSESQVISQATAAAGHEVIVLEETRIGSSSGETLYGSDSNDYIDAKEGNDIVEGEGGRDYLIGGDGDDFISLWYLNAGDSTLMGGNGADSVTADVGADLVYGDLGNDTLNGAPGNDLIYGGNAANDSTDGADSIRGGYGLDTIYGNAGNDIIYGGTAVNDTFDGADNIYAGSGSDTVYGNGGNDLIYGGNGGGDSTDLADTIYGGEGNDTINGNGGSDVIYGGLGSGDSLDGADYINAGQANDTVNGAGGNDTILGAAGIDSLTGGSGLDYYVYNSITDSGIGSGNRDIIAFNQGHGDIIDLSIFTGTFSFIGTSAFSAANQVRYFQDVPNSLTIVELNVDSTLTVDMQLQLTGLFTLTGGDFIL